MASEDKMKSISFPAIGTGKLLVPSGECARIMLDEIAHFTTSEKTCSLKNINIVVYWKDKDTLKAFSDRISRLRGSNTGSHVDRAEKRETSSATNGRPEKREGDKKTRRGCKNDDDGDDDDDDDSKESKNLSSWIINEVSFQIVHGNLLDCRSDVLVNSTNLKFNVSVGAVSKAIMEKAGHSVVKECKNHGPLVDNMAVTSAGHLPNKRLIHVHAKDPDEWKKVISNMLDKAEEMKMKSLAMPPLGTRKGAETHVDMASAIIKSVQTFADKKPKYLKQIFVCILDDELLKTFSETFRTKTLPGWKRLKKSVEDFFTNLTRTNSNTDEQPDVRTTTNGRTSTNGRTNESGKSQSYGCSNYNIQLDIYAMNDKNIDKAIQEIKKSVDQMTSTETIECPVKLSDEEIKNMEKKHAVSVKLDGGKTLKVKGESLNILAASKDINELITKKRDKEKLDREIALFSKYATWTYSYDNTSATTSATAATTPAAAAPAAALAAALVAAAAAAAGTSKSTVSTYGQYSTGMLERAFQMKQSDKVTFVSNDKIRHSVDVLKMTDYFNDGANKCVAKVKRVPKKKKVPTATLR